jgi:hypothetical protein
VVEPEPPASGPVSRQDPVASVAVNSSRLTVAGVVALALLLAPDAPSAAGVAPKTELRVGAESQRGGLVWEEWTSGDGQHCVTNSADGPGTFPKPLSTSPGHHRARFLLLRSQKPTAVKITAWRSVNSHGQATGPKKEVPFTLRPRRGDGGRITAWRARFSVDLPPAYYLHLFASWPDGRCGGPRHLLRTYSIRVR